MDLSAPHQSLGIGLPGDLLVALASGRGLDGLSGRQLAEVVNRPHVTVSRALGPLVEQGLVSRRSVPPALVYRLNFEHIAAPLVEEMAQLRSALFDRFRARIGTWAIAPAQITLFGSTARGEGTATSDLDLLVVRPAPIGPDDADWRAQLDLLAHSAHAWTGNHVQFLELDDAELRVAHGERSTTVVAALDHGIPLTKPALDSYLRTLNRRA